jgi:hypothetical protein
MEVNVFYNDNTCQNQNNILNSTLFSISPQDCARNPEVLFQLICADSAVKVTRCDSNFTALQVPSPLTGCTPVGTLPNFRNTGKKDSYYINQPCIGNKFEAAVNGNQNSITAVAFSPGQIFGICVGVLALIFMSAVGYYFYQKQYRKRAKVLTAKTEEETELEEYPNVVVVKKVDPLEDFDQESASDDYTDGNSLNRDQTLYKKAERRAGKGKEVADEDGKDLPETGTLKSYSGTVKSFSIRRNGTLLNSIFHD